jgi:hypothetical protein
VIIVYQSVQKVFALGLLYLMLFLQMTCCQNATAQMEPQKTTRLGVTYVSRDWNHYLDYNQTTLDNIKEHGFNIVRLALYWKAYNPEPGVYDKNAFGNLTSILNWASKNDIQTILEFHFSFYLHPDPTIPLWLGSEQNRYAENFLFNNTSVSAFIAYENHTVQAVKQYAATILGVELNEPFFTSNATSPAQNTIVNLFRKWLENKYYGSISLLNQTWSRQPLAQDEQTFDQVNFPVEKNWYSPRWVDYYTFIQDRYINITKSFKGVAAASLPGSRVMVSYNEGVWWTGILYSDENTQAVFPQKYLSTRGLHTYPSIFGNLNNTLNTLKIYFDARLFSGYDGQTWITEAATKHPVTADYQNASSVLRIASLLLKAQPDTIVIWNAMTGQNDSFSIFYPNGKIRDFGKAWSWIASLQPKVSTSQPHALIIMPTIGTPLWYNYFSSTYSTALALYESGVNFDIWVGPALPDNAILSKYKSVLLPDSTSFNETWAKTTLQDYVRRGGSLFVGRGQQVDWNMKQTTPSADSFYYFSDKPTSEKSLENTAHDSSVASDFYDLKAGSVFNFTFSDVAYFPKAQEVGSTVVPIIKDSDGDILAATTTYGDGKVLFFGGWADFSQNIDGYVLLVHSFLKWDGTVKAYHQLQSPNLLDSGWIELNDGGRLRIASNIGTATYNLDDQYAIPPGKILVLADQNSTFDRIADFAQSSPDISFRVVAPSSIP